jgi:hypothetical protein
LQAATRSAVRPSTGPGEAVPDEGVTDGPGVDEHVGYRVGDAPRVGASTVPSREEFGAGRDRQPELRRRGTL